MWIATKVGFFSIVRKEGKDFHVRARLRPDLVELMDLAGIESEIFESEYADYRFRIVVDSDTVRKIGAMLFKEIDYDNFKNTIHNSSIKWNNAKSSETSGFRCGPCRKAKASDRFLKR